MTFIKNDFINGANLFLTEEDVYNEDLNKFFSLPAALKARGHALLSKARKSENKNEIAVLVAEGKFLLQQSFKSHVDEKIDLDSF